MDVFSKVQSVSLTQLRVGSELFPNSVSKFPFVTGMVVACAEAIKALSPMAAMPRPQSLRRGRKFTGVMVVLDRDVVFMVFVSMVLSHGNGQIRVVWMVFGAFGLAF